MVIKSNGLLKHIPVLVKSHPASGRENPWYILIQAVNDLLI
jgi:hypothetical protein